MAKKSAQNYAQVYEDIILKMNSSVNVYMFFGGTNFGFMNGGNGVNKEGKVDVVLTSYDYEAPLSEAGLITILKLYVYIFLIKYMFAIES